MLATAAIEQKHAESVAAAAVASAESCTKDAAAPPLFETEIVAASEAAVTDVLDPVLFAEAAQLRRKRLEVSNISSACCCC